MFEYAFKLGIALLNCIKCFVECFAYIFLEAENIFPSGFFWYKECFSAVRGGVFEEFFNFIWWNMIFLVSLPEFLSAFFKNI
jgi:hypothetical protein